MVKLLEDKVVVVTGASGGIGGEVVLLAAEYGAKVVATYHTHKKRAEKLVKLSAEKNTPITVVNLDVTDDDEVKRFFKKLGKTYGQLDALLNVAGHSDRDVWFSALENLDGEKWLDVFKTDLLGSFFCSREASKLMENGGSIVNFSSSAAVTGHNVGLPYTVAKAALIGLTKSLAIMLGPKIRVNAVAPGNIDTGSIAWYRNGEKRKMAEEASLKRIGSRREVAETALFLASDRASFITGHILMVDGGI